MYTNVEKNSVWIEPFPIEKNTAINLQDLHVFANHKHDETQLIILTYYNI